jgi:hypothetical protein
MSLCRLDGLLLFSTVAATEVADSIIAKSRTGRTARKFCVDECYVF